MVMLLEQQQQQQQQQLVTALGELKLLSMKEIRTELLGEPNAMLGAC